MSLNTASSDRHGMLWFTGQGGVYGSLDPRSGRLRVLDAPGGPGPYGITTTPGGEVWYASPAGSHVARIDPATAAATRFDPPTAGQGARRVWSDSKGRLWVSEWNAGRLGSYDPATRHWMEWRLPGRSPQPYAVYVDDRDAGGGEGRARAAGPGGVPVGPLCSLPLLSTARSAHRGSTGVAPAHCPYRRGWPRG